MSVFVCCYSFYPACPFFSLSLRAGFALFILFLSVVFLPPEPSFFFYPVPSFLFLFAVCLFPACSFFSACPFSPLVPFGGIFAAGAFFLFFIRCLLYPVPSFSFSLSLSHRAGFVLFSGSAQRSGLSAFSGVCLSLPPAFRLPFAWLKTVTLKASLKNRYKITNNF